ncbi:FecR family protein [uncultured Draconibacterium sp.]|uniref:FecR family protein n=1 Tax=uncultured Draconibacterium sp. TaxID=1573823 RepID=UPI0025FC410F|nr:FecR family protein [uncultured Draconibacterium sp.]
MQRKYTDIDDFLFSENYNEYVIKESVRQQKKWKAYFKEFPDTKYAATQARKIILGLDSMEDYTSLKEIPDVKLHNQFEDTWSKYRGEKSKTVLLKTSKVIYRSVAAAAAVVFLMISFTLVNNYISNKNTAPEYFGIYVPTAEQSRLTLPDGTKVWVNSETEIKYSNQFNTKERDIILLGEAYFEVAHNEKLPFNVIANGAKIKVTGTKFNVKGYGDDDSVETVLLEGRVELSRVGDKSGNSIELEPGDKATLNLEDSKVLISREDVLDVIAWKDGKMVFRNIPLHEVCKTLQRHFDADIVLAGDAENLYNHPFTFTIENETLPMILEYLCKAAPLMYNTKYIDEDGQNGIEKIEYIVSAR